MVYKLLQAYKGKLSHWLIAGLVGCSNTKWEQPGLLEAEATQRHSRPSGTPLNSETGSRQSQNITMRFLPVLQDSAGKRLSL